MSAVPRADERVGRTTPPSVRTSRRDHRTTPHRSRRDIDCPSGVRTMAVRPYGTANAPRVAVIETPDMDRPAAVDHRGRLRVVHDRGRAARNGVSAGWIHEVVAVSYVCGAAAVIRRRAHHDRRVVAPIGVAGPRGIAERHAESAGQGWRCTHAEHAHPNGEHYTGHSVCSRHQTPPGGNRPFPEARLAHARSLMRNDSAQSKIVSTGQIIFPNPARIAHNYFLCSRLYMWVRITRRIRMNWSRSSVARPARTSAVSASRALRYEV